MKRGLNEIGQFEYYNLLFKIVVDWGNEGISFTKQNVGGKAICGLYQGPRLLFWWVFSFFDSRRDAKGYHSNKSLHESDQRQPITLQG